MEFAELFKMATEAATRSYSPYSKFRVGAALLCEDGTVVCAANVENRSYGLAICAERSAMVSAIAQGKKEFRALAISCPDAAYPVSPCGACRQFISEFVGAEFPIRFGGSGGGFVDTTMGELLPHDALHELASRP
ncbi:MAG: cytidine deaminase [Spirochaetae bacterium HGW-Spirochaetae-3]|jgi:cytidine deaminase|nr:MAG: cytidine deaminase [Spirochaetae bacterium HGW-Spirochaetae-3]